MDMIKLSILLVVILFTAVAAVYAAGAKLELNPVFSEHMVLQRDVPLEIYGTSGPGRKVTVEIGGQKASGVSDGYGNWSVTLKPITAGGPRALVVTSGKESITLGDVLAGDVWFCSGQSNMEWPLVNTIDGAEELKNFQPQPNIRLFLQQQKAAPKPMKEASGSWAECSAENAKNFSAVAYFFAKNMQKDNSIPIGVIDSAWGGTSIEIWMKESLLKGNPVTEPIVARWKSNPVYDWKNWNNGKGMNYNFEISDIRFESSSGKAEALPVSTGAAWSANAKQDSKAVFTAGKAGKISGVIGFNAWANTDTQLKNGEDIDLSAYDTVKFKVKGMGKFSISLGQKNITDWDFYSSRDYEAAVKQQEISIALPAFKQGGWGLAKPFTQSAIDLFKINIKSPSIELPSALYNGMVEPFGRYKIKGALWYQGENNAGRAKQYQALLPMMIGSWRKLWGYDFPFFIVQLTSFMERKAEPGESERAELREAQLKASAIPGVAVVSIIDLGDAKDIHPRIKEPVGARLAQAAKVMLFGKEGPMTGPLYEKYRFEGNKMVLYFNNIGKGMEAKNGYLKGFSIAGDDRVFKWAKAEIKDNTVIVWNDEIKEPKAVRYAWADNPECNLYNKEGLAASPFRTDDWPGLTDNNY